MKVFLPLILAVCLSADVECGDDVVISSLNALVQQQAQVIQTLQTEVTSLKAAVQQQTASQQQTSSTLNNVVNRLNQRGK